MALEEKRSGAGKGRRTVPRVKAEKLPQGLREFRLVFDHGTYQGTTIDASLTGISFRVQVPANRIREFLVQLVSADGTVDMTQEIVYIKPLDNEYSRISLMFDEQSTPEAYRRQLRRALRQR